MRRGKASATPSFIQARISVVAFFHSRWNERPKTTTTVTEETTSLLDVLVDNLSSCAPGPCLLNRAGGRAGAGARKGDHELLGRAYELFGRLRSVPQLLPAEPLRSCAGTAARGHEHEPLGRGRERFEQLCICEHLRSGCRGCLAHQRVGVPKPLLQEETQRLLVMLVHDLSCALATTWAPATSRCVR